MKHSIDGNCIEIVVSENTLTIIRECSKDDTIEYNRPCRKSLLFEGVMKYHGGYPDKIRNGILCPLLDLLLKDLNGMVVLKEYFNK